MYAKAKADKTCQKRKGFGWKRWSRDWLYDALGLYADDRVRRTQA